MALLYDHHFMDIYVTVSQSRALATTEVSVDRVGAGSRTVNVSNAGLQASAGASIGVTVPTVTVSASASQPLGTTPVAVTRTLPPSRTVSLSNATLQTSPGSSVTATVPSVTVSASISQGLSVTAVGVTRVAPPTRTVSVSNAALQTSAASSVTVTVPSVTITATTSQGLSTTGVGVSREKPSSRNVNVSNAALQTSVGSSVTVLVEPEASLSASNIFAGTAQYDASATTHPTYSNSEMTFDYDPDINTSPPPALQADAGEKTKYDYRNASFKYDDFETVTVEVRVTDPDGNSDTATDTCSVGNV